jgi:hypothetical protein
MKKIITLLLMIGAFVTSFAQSRTIDKAKEVITKEPRNNPNTRYPSSSTSRQAEIDEVNRTYDSKIQAVRANPLLSAAEKERRIRDLEYERAQRIREINNRYYGNSDGTYSKNKNKNKAYKTNNGKHLGWEKGKGNPHRTGAPVKGNGNGKGKGKNK